MQERLEASPVGRAAISLFAVVTVLALVFWNLPESEAKRQSMRVVRPYVNALGLDQNWSVFAPDPPTTIVQFEARTLYADGGDSVWRPPRHDPFVAAYWDYRWLKWAEWVTSDQHEKLWRPAAAWIERRERDKGREPIAVALARRSHPLNPPGSKESRGKSTYYEYYDASAAPAQDATP